MVKRVQHIRHITADADAYLGLQGEFTQNTDTSEIRSHDGATVGGLVIQTVIQNDLRYQLQSTALTNILVQSTGFMVNSAANAYLRRVMAGTANEITITNGDGVAGNPTVSLPAAMTLTGKTVTGGTFNSVTLANPTFTGGISGLSTVAISGLYADLLSKPTLGTAAALNTGLASGDIPRLLGTSELPALGGAKLTSLTAAALLGTVPIASLGSGSTNKKFLRGDQIFAVPSPSTYIDITGSVATPYDITASDAGLFLGWSNSGVAGIITLPGASSPLAADQSGYIRNDDATATVTIQAKAGTGTLTLVERNAAFTTGIVLQPGDLVFYQVDSTAGKVQISGRYTPVTVQGLTKNLKILVASNTSATTTADSVVVFDGVTYKTISALNLAKTTAAFVAGNAAGGLDTGAVGASSWYYVWAIAKADGTADVLYSLSATAPTMPTGYTFKARIGTLITNGSNLLIGTLQVGKHVQYVVGGPNLAAALTMATGAAGSATVPTWVAIAVGAFVPPTAVAIQISASVLAVTNLIVAPNNSYGAAGASWAYIVTVSGVAAPAVLTMWLESTNIYWASGNGKVMCLGWEEA